jgi:two-component system chemotaxis sensor kinase CheA
MPKNIDDETREILLSFVSEGYERLDDSETQLSKLDDGENTQQLNSIFRLFHSVKGSAGYLGFENIKMLTHEAETLLEVFLKEKVPVNPDAIDVIYETVDVLRKLIAIVEKEYTDESGAEAVKAQTAVVKAMIQTLRGKRPDAEEPPLKVPSIPNEIFLSDLVTRDMVQRFIGECADLADRTEKIALGITPKTVCTDQVHEMFRAVHTIKGNSGFFGYSFLEALCMDLETVLDGARKSNQPVTESFVNNVIRTIDRIRASLNTLVIYDQGAKVSPPSAAEADEPKGETSAYKPLGEILVDMGVIQHDAIQEALEDQERPLGEILLQKGSVGKEDLAEALKIQKAQGPSPDQDATKDVVRKEIRVDTSKLDKLFELVGELITAESMVINNADLSGLKLDSFSKAFSSLNKISREIQETTMQIRMIPLDGLFQKMTRLVRDLSRKFDRPVNFIVSGQDTEMDKNVIEQISDPLVHILRNSIDHGIESREIRKQTGKPETGTVCLNARYEGSEIWISIKDDGAGLNREKILAKAAKNGILKSDPATMSDKDVYGFIFEPGFSTADVVSEVSGRGVGLDVVKKNLERIRGKVEINTEPGKGTEFILTIPLTMAIIDGITVRAGKNRYSIPLNDIFEFFKVVPEQVTRTEKNEETINIRNSFLPLIKLADVFKIPGATTNACDGIIIVVQNNGRKACLLIDEVIGNQQIVVKSLSEYLGKVEGLSGCSILGDGGVSFIIDTGKLLSMKLE